MKKVLYIVNQGLISSNANGGASVYYSHLELLYKAGFQIDVLAVEWSDRDVFNIDDYKEINQFVSEIKTYKIKSKTPKIGFNRLYKAFFKPEEFEYYFLNDDNKKYLQNLIDETNIDFVFGDWRWAGIWACFSNLKVPVIYGHHDWEYKLAKLRKKRNLLQKFHTFQKKRVEFRLIKKVAGSVSGSFTETKEIETISAKKALYLPTTYKEITPKLSANNIPNIVHLGGMGTTANRLGLERFLDVCWSDISKKNPSVKLIIIGSLKQGTPTLSEKLKHKNIVCKGFVEDLQEVLHPQDIHIIPWEFNTGTRTRIPVVLNYEQVLVATKASVKAFPEFVDSKNAILCDNLQSMTLKVNELLQNVNSLETISKAGKQTFLNHFTVDKNLDKFKNFIQKFL